MSNYLQMTVSVFLLGIGASQIVACTRQDTDESPFNIPSPIRINLSPRHFIPHDVCDADGWLSG